MINLQETVREKRIRFLVIILILLVTAGAFYWRHQQMLVQKEAEIPPPLAAVVHESEGKHDHPLVAVYQYKEDAHIAALYEIDFKEGYLFKTIAAAKLERAPEEMAPDRKEIGVWMKFSGKWRYFNDLLEEEKRPANTRNTVEPVQFAAKEDRKGTTIIIAGERRQFHLDTREKVLAVHSLAADKSLWLAVTESQFFILHH